MEKQITYHKLPGLTELLKDSWQMFKGSLLHVFLINLIGFGIYAGLFLILLLITVPLGIFSVLEIIKTQTLSASTGASLGGIGIILVVFIAACIMVGLALHAATLIVVANYKKSPSVGEALKRGFGFVVPLFLVNLLLAFIITGGYFLLIIPGVFLAIVLSFTVYEVVLAKNSITGAARRSIRIITSHFWGIFGRMALWAIIVIAIVNIPNAFSFTGDGYNPSMSGLQFILQILVTWFGISYSITLYKQAEAASKPGESKLLWPIIVGIVGWIIGIIITVALITFVTTTLIPQIQQNFKPKKAIRNAVVKEVRRDAVKALPTLNPTQKANLQKVQKTVNTVQKVQDAYQNYKTQ